MKTEIVMEKGSGRDRLTGKQTEKHSARQMKTKQVWEMPSARLKREKKKSNIGKREPARKNRAEETPVRPKLQSWGFSVPCQSRPPRQQVSCGLTDAHTDESITGRRGRMSWPPGH